MTRRICPNRLSLLIIFLFLSNSFGLRDYEIQYDGIKCIGNMNFAKYISCSINKSSGYPVLNLEGETSKQIKDGFIDYVIYITNRKNKFSPVFVINRANYCDLYNAYSSIKMIKALREMFEKAGTISACPIPAGYHYKYANLTFDTEYLPAYVPRVSIKSVFVFSEKKTVVITVTALARIISKKKKIKGRRNF